MCVCAEYSSFFSIAIKNFTELDRRYCSVLKWVMDNAVQQ